MALAEALFGEMEKANGNAEEKRVPINTTQLPDVGIWRTGATEPSV